MDQAGLTQYLVGREREAIIRTLAMMAYNAAIGRVLARGSVGQFCDLMAGEIPKMYSAQDQRSFEEWHTDLCWRIIQKLRTVKGDKLSYGQAQKPLNVFLKVYVAWAKLPEGGFAQKLTPWLHCPLDSVVMTFIARNFRELYAAEIGALRQYKLDRSVERTKETAKRSRTVAKRALGSEFSLVAIDKELYLQWQSLFRRLWPGKPVELDVIWALERRPSSGEAGGSCEE